METEQTEQFTINSDSLAEWALDLLRTNEQERDRLQKLADEKIEFYTAQKAELDKRFENDTSWIKMQLRVYFESIATDKLHSTKTQTKYKLLSGELVLKQPGPKFTTDDETLTAWMKTSHPEFVKVTEKAQWGDFKTAAKVQFINDRVLTDDGEVVEGVTAEIPSPVFEVKLKGE